MKRTTRNVITLALTLVGAALIMAGSGCAKFGANPTPPTRLEQGLFKVETNYVPVVVTKTNTVFETNTVIVTVLKTNDAGYVYKEPTPTEVVTPHATVVQETNHVQATVLTPGAGAQEVAATGRAVGNMFMPGLGEMVSAGLLAVFGLWGHLRSYKGRQTASALAQEVETIREFIKTLPQGTNYDIAITSWLQTHQIEMGVLPSVLSLLQKQVSNPEAVAAIRQIEEAIQITTPRPAPPSA